MAKIYRGNLPQKINVVIDGKVITTANFDETGVYETENKAVIKELKEYGYKVEEQAEAEAPTEVAPTKTRKKIKDLD